MSDFLQRFEEIIERTGAKPSGGSWQYQGHCPAHDDRSPSLSISLKEDKAFNAVFPAKRQSRVTIILASGERFQATTLDTKGDPETPASYAEMVEKFQAFLAESPHQDRAVQLQTACLSLAQDSAQSPAIADIIYSRT